MHTPINVFCQNSDNISDEGHCPTSHPYVYKYGEWCCQTKKEKIYTPQGEHCDGSVIQGNSLCCEGDRNIMCPDETCVDYLQKGNSRKISKELQPF